MSEEVKISMGSTEAPEDRELPDVPMRTNDDKHTSVKVTSGIDREGSILSTARNLGSNFTSPIVDEDTVVTVGNIEMKVRQAMAQGFLVKDSDGSIRDASPEELKVTEEREAQKENEKTHEHRFTSEDEPQAVKDMNEFVDNTLSKFGSPDSDIVEYLQTGTMNENVIKAAEVAGISGDEMLGKIEQVIDVVTLQAEEILLSQGITEDEIEAVWELEGAIGKGKAISGALNLLRAGDKRHYVKLAQVYRQTHPKKLKTA